MDRTIFGKLLDTFFPPSEETILVRNLDADTVQQLYQKTFTHETWVLTSYKDARVRALIHEAKFHGNTRACTLLKILIEKFIQEHVKLLEVTLPIPLSERRMRVRGYNQVTQILREVHAPLHIHTDILIRTRNTRPQTELRREERLVNMRDAFSVLHGEKITGRHILLVDDVLTTGTTLSMAKASLLPYAPASITCLALAH